METGQDFKNEMEVMKKTQIEGKSDKKNLCKQTETTETNIAKSIQEKEEKNLRH